MFTPACRLLAVLLIVACTGCSSGGRSTTRTIASAPDSSTVVAVNAADIQAIAARPGARATLVNVWATWCAPCREEFPSLLEVARARRADGLRLVLVSADFEDQVPSIRRFLAERGVTDTSYLKTGDDVGFIEAMSPRWSGALPATFVYDARGRLRAFWEGAADSGRFSSAVDQVFADQSSTETVRP